MHFEHLMKRFEKTVSGFFSEIQKLDNNIYPIKDLIKQGC